MHFELDVMQKRFFKSNVVLQLYSIVVKMKKCRFWNFRKPPSQFSQRKPSMHKPKSVNNGCIKKAAEEMEFREAR